ncbi:MAG: beta-N-acetylhexosaminidase [Anaerolineae bacterium]|nr:beta-N-acetylhexosaminidase [Anaerolineae bacterium]
MPESSGQLDHLAGQMLLVGFDGLTAPDYVLDWLAAGKAGGVILFTRNVASPEQVAALTASLRAAATYPPLVAIDQEGGTVARLRHAQGFTESPGALALAAAGDAEQTEAMCAALAAEMRAVGINWDFAPVLDILYNRHNPSLGTRSFGVTAAKVARLASAAVRGFQRGGVAACAKHFPGLGNTAIDTHRALPALDVSLDQLRARDLEPYRAALADGLASVMTTHTRFTALDEEHPATLSAGVIKALLRDELGFDGVVTTDCMEMKAIADHYGPAEAAVRAALADVDVILFSHTREMQEKAYAGLLAAAQSGRLPLERLQSANRRIAALKARFTASDSVSGPGDLSSIRRPEHLDLARRAARAGTVLVKSTPGLLPLAPAHGATVLVEFASALESDVMERGGLTGLAALFRQRAPRIHTIALRGEGADHAALSEAITHVMEANVCVLAVRNAALTPRQLEQARQIMNAARNVVIIALRSPFDVAALPGAGVVLCTCGDAMPSLEAAFDALTGGFEPWAALPFALDEV